MSKESAIQSLKERVDEINTFGKLVACSDGYPSMMHILSAPSIVEEYAKWKLMDLNETSKKEAK